MDTAKKASKALDRIGTPYLHANRVWVNKDVCIKHYVDRGYEVKIYVSQSILCKRMLLFVLKLPTKGDIYISKHTAMKHVSRVTRSNVELFCEVKHHKEHDKNYTKKHYHTREFIYQVMKVSKPNTQLIDMVAAYDSQSQIDLTDKIEAVNE